MAYAFKTIPEAVWLALSAGVAGLVASIMSAYDVDSGIVAATGVMIAAAFRFVIALIAAIGSTDGTVSTS